MEEEKQRTHILNWEHDITRNRFINVNVFHHWLRYVITTKHIKPGDWVLEIGCGTGFLPKMLYRNQIQTTFIGVDYDAKNIEKATMAKDKKEMYGTESFVCARFGTDNHMFPENELFDVIFTSHVIEHMPRDEGIKFLNEIKRLMKPGGKLLIATPNGDAKPQDDYHIYEWGKDELMTELSRREFNYIGGVSSLNTIHGLEKVLEEQKNEFLTNKYLELKKVLPRNLIITIFTFLLGENMEDIYLFYEYTPGLQTNKKELSVPERPLKYRKKHILSATPIEKEENTGFFK